MLFLFINKYKYATILYSFIFILYFCFDEREEGREGEEEEVSL